MPKIAAKHMGFLWVLLSALFLFNPTVACVDILPDAIGYLFLWIGLSRLADLNDYIEEALRRVKILFWFSVIHLALYSLISDTIAMADPVLKNPLEDRSFTLLFALIRMLFQCFLLIPAYRAMFRGIDRLADRFGDGVLSRERRGRTAADRMASRSTTFVIANSLLSVLPEATSLTSGDLNTTASFDWYDFIFMFRVLSVMLSLIFSTVWLIFFICYFVRVLRRREWLKKLRVSYGTDVLTQVGMLRVRRFSRAFIMLAIGVIFALSVRVDHGILFPGIVLAVLVPIAMGHLGKLLPKWKQCIAPSVFLGVASLVHWILNHVYFKVNLYVLEESIYNEKAFWLFFTMRIFGAIEAVATAVLLFYVLQQLQAIVRLHTRVSYDTPGSEELSMRATERLHKTFEKKSALAFVFFAAASVVGMVDSALQMHYPWIWAIAFVFSFVGICLFWSFLRELTDEIRNRYFSVVAHKKS